MTWFDAHEWVHDKLTTALPSCLVTPEQDAKINKYPAVVWELSTSNPDPLGIWTGNLTINLLCKVDDAPGLQAAIYAEVGSWETPGPLNTAELQTFTQNRSAVSESTKQYIYVYSLVWDR